MTWYKPWTWFGKSAKDVKQMFAIIDGLSKTLESLAKTVSKLASAVPDVTKTVADGNIRTAVSSVLPMVSSVETSLIDTKREITELYNMPGFSKHMKKIIDPLLTSVSSLESIVKATRLTLDAVFKNL